MLQIPPLPFFLQLYFLQNQSQQSEQSQQRRTKHILCKMCPMCAVVVVEGEFHCTFDLHRLMKSMQRSPAYFSQGSIWQFLRGHLQYSLFYHLASS